MKWVLLAIYASCLGFIFIYSLVQLYLVLRYRKRSHPNGYTALEDWPDVTVQLPVYNEFYVIERLIDSVCKLKFPLNRLEIQLIDDSTDESFEKGSRLVKKWRKNGVNIHQLRREDRRGFKAGALDWALKQAKGEFIAVFDADFTPDPDFLLRTVPLFQDEHVGVVQTRWGHINRDYSLLTRLQAFGLDAHFSVEQGGRHAGGHFINFNGTAGVWRKGCIEDSGGWSDDTLTEDLDLSYRAQMRGWRFKYVEEVESPAELPAEMNGLKGQQYRWTKGAAECAVKHLPRVLKQPGLSTGTRVNAIFHLLNSAIFICVLGAAVTSVPLVWFKVNGGEALSHVFHLASIMFLGFIFLAWFYFTGQRQIEGESKLKRFAIEFPLFLSFSMGMSLYNSVAVLEGYLGRKTPFVRTPKYNLTHRKAKWQKTAYALKRIPAITWLELLLSLYFLAGIVLGIMYAEFGWTIFHLMLFAGFSSVSYLSFRHARQAA